MVKQNTAYIDDAENKQLLNVGQQSSGSTNDASMLSTVAAASNSSLLNSPLDFNEWLENGNWDELKSIFDLSFDPFF